MHKTSGQSQFAPVEGIETYSTVLNSFSARLSQFAPVEGIETVIRDNPYPRTVSQFAPVEGIETVILRDLEILLCRRNSRPLRALKLLFAVVDRGYAQSQFAPVEGIETELIDRGGAFVRGSQFAPVEGIETSQ